MPHDSLKVADVLAVLEAWAPLALSESWDNTGLLLGDRGTPCSRMMTCLTLTPDSVAEAVEERADLVVSHHPLPFKPLAQITTDSQTGAALWQLARAGISLYSPHTAWDSAEHGINAQLANRLGLLNVRPLIPSRWQPVADAAGAAQPSNYAAAMTAAAAGQPAAMQGAGTQGAGTLGAGTLGAGRAGELPEPLSLEAFGRLVSAKVPHCRPRAVVGPARIRRVGIGCGSGGSFLSAAAALDCDLLLTGEATFHTCLEAQGLRLGLFMIGHFASEKFAMDVLAAQLAAHFPQAVVWSSRREHDPVVTLAGPGQRLG
jgi:dinuclear metal center YbgI/SA1388 family protein